MDFFWIVDVWNIHYTEWRVSSFCIKVSIVFFTLSKENVVFSSESRGCPFWSLCLKCNEFYVQKTLTIIISTKLKRFLLCCLCRWYSTSSKMTVAFRKPVHAPSLHHFRYFWRTLFVLAGVTASYFTRLLLLVSRQNCSVCYLVIAYSIFSSFSWLVMDRIDTFH